MPPIYEESGGSFEKSSALSVIKKKINYYDKNMLKNSARVSKPTDIVYEGLLSLILF